MQLTQVLKVSADHLLADDDIQEEQVVKSIRIGEAVFDVVEKPAMILAGRVVYAKNFDSIPALVILDSLFFYTRCYRSIVTQQSATFL